MKKRLLLVLAVLTGLFLLSASIVCAHGMHHDDDTEYHHDNDTGNHHDDDTGHHHDDDTGHHYDNDTGNHHDDDTGHHHDDDTGNHHDDDTGHHYDNDTGNHQHHTVLEDYDLCVWDYSGNYTDSRDNMTLNCTLIQDANGKLTGDGTFDYSSDEIALSIPVEIKGKVKGKNSIVTLQYKVKGKDAEGNKLKDKVSLEQDEKSLFLMGSIKRKLCANGSGCEVDTSQVSLNAPNGMTGEAVLSIDTTSDEKGKKHKGTGELVLSNGDIYNLSAKGKYNSNQNVTQFQLKGADGPAKGIRFKIKIDEESDATTFIKGKAHNQNLEHK